MNGKIKLLITIVLVAIFFGAALFLYNSLSKEYAPEVFNEPVNTGESEESGDESEGHTISAPDFTVLNEKVDELKLSDYFGKPIVLNFWATWCGYCVEEMPDFDRAYKEHPEVQFLMVNATDGVRETTEKAKQFLEEKGFTFPVVYDTQQSAVYAYYVTGFPSTYFIDAEGSMVTYFNGMLSYENLIKGIGFITE